VKGEIPIEISISNKPNEKNIADITENKKKVSFFHVILMIFGIHLVQTAFEMWQQLERESSPHYRCS